MNFIELVTQRSSVRNFEPKPVEKEKLIYVLEAARIAPSAVNFQPWQFFVITDPEMLKLIQSVYHREWLVTAPAIVIAMAGASGACALDPQALRIINPNSKIKAGIFKRVFIFFSF